MLTPDLARATRRGSELKLTPLSAAQRARAEELAEALLGMARASVGQSRGELREAFADVTGIPKEQRLAQGLAKLIEDAAEFEEECAADPQTLRSELFLRASEARRSGVFDRDELIAHVAASHSLEPEALESSLFADLKTAHRLKRAPPMSPQALVENYELCRVQAVLLRATRLTARVRSSNAAVYRELFQKLKFRRLLFNMTRDGAGYRIEIDGPYSLFESVTKYGLALALSVPALLECDEVELSAQVLWGKLRKPLSFEFEVSKFAASGRSRGGTAEPVLCDEAARLLAAFEDSARGWSCQVADVVLELPGVGLCVPDLVFERRRDGTRVFLEIMGYWSRDAVFRRIELAEAGLAERVLFAVSSRLRVSERALGSELPAALCVYKGSLSPRQVEQHLEALAERSPRRTG